MKTCFIICDGLLGCLVNIFQFSDVPYKDREEKKKESYKYYIVIKSKLEAVITK